MAGAQRALELAERRRRVVRDADPADPPRLALRLEPRQMLLPGDEVVHLLELDAAEPLELVRVLLPCFGRRGRPDLRQDGRLVAAAGERKGERLLGAVHRRACRSSGCRPSRAARRRPRECRRSPETCSTCQARRPARDGAPPSAEQLPRRDARGVGGAEERWILVGATAHVRERQAGASFLPALAVRRRAAPRPRPRREVEDRLLRDARPPVALSRVGFGRPHGEHGTAAEGTRRVPQRRRGPARRDRAACPCRRSPARPSRRSPRSRRRAASAQRRGGGDAVEVSVEARRDGDRNARAIKLLEPANRVGERDRKRSTLHLDVSDADARERRADRRDLAVDGAEDDRRAVEQPGELAVLLRALAARAAPACTGAPSRARPPPPAARARASGSRRGRRTRPSRARAAAPARSPAPRPRPRRARSAADRRRTGCRRPRAARAGRTTRRSR